MSVQQFDKLKSYTCPSQFILIIKVKNALNLYIFELLTMTIVGRYWVSNGQIRGSRIIEYCEPDRKI